MKVNGKTESIYEISIKDVNNSQSAKAISELNSFLKVDSVTTMRNSSRINKLNCKSEVYSDNRKEAIVYEEEERKTNILPSMTYVPKSKVKFTPSNLLSYSNPRTFGRKNFTADEKNEMLTGTNTQSFHQFGSTTYNLNNNKPDAQHLQPLANNRFNSETDYLTFKTNFVLKFAKNIDLYDRLGKSLDIISENNKKIISDSQYKLRSLTGKKDRILFDAMHYNILTNNSNSTQNVQHWKDCTVFFYDSEVVWLRLTEYIMKELKSSKDNNIMLSKKANDQENLLIARENEIKELKAFIEDNDLNYKSVVKKKKAKDTNDVKSEYDKKEKLNLINMFRLEEEYYFLLFRIKDLTSLLDKDKEIYTKYYECLDQIEMKKREIEEIRVRFNQETEEKKLKIAYLNNEKHELNQTINQLEKELTEFKLIYDNSKKDYIEFHTQIKILRQGMEEKKENILMLTEEVETWMNELQKEKLSNHNTQQTVTALEIKIQSLLKEKNNLMKGIIQSPNS